MLIIYWNKWEVLQFKVEIPFWIVLVYWFLDLNYICVLPIVYFETLKYQTRSQIVLKTW